jgi:CelD/BcsL family acetyltransferase involved in cellulose biosynthesis
MSDYWRISIVTDWDEIYSTEFQKKWLSWSENAFNSHVFLHPTLCMAWLDSYRPLRLLDPLFCIAEGETGTLFLPLVLWRRNWKNAFQKLIIPVGYSDFDYHDPLVDRQLSDDKWTTFYELLAYKLRAKTRFDGIKINGLRTEIIGSHWSVENEIAPFCDLSLFKSSEYFLQSLGLNLRRNILKQTRRIEKMGPIRLFSYNNENDAIRVLPDFLNLHTERWPRAYKAPGFHHYLIKYCIDAGVIHFTTLKSGEEILSYHMGFIFKGRYYCYMIALNPEYEYYSPGTVHLFKLIEYAYDKQCHIFDFLRGGENYKSGWTKYIRSLYKYEMISDNFSSHLKDKILSFRTSVL